MRPRSGSTFRKEHLQSNVIGFSNDATSTYLAATEQWAELTPLLSFAFSAAKACDEMVWVPPATSDFAMRGSGLEGSLALASQDCVSSWRQIPSSCD